jgi:hypothetical protein
MPQYAAVSRDRHANQRWLRYDTYSFAAQNAVVPLVAAEFPKAMMAFPLAFVNENEAFVPVAVLSLEPQRNLFVAPDGRWLGGYVPSAFRSHPFRLIKSDSGELVLCVDEDSGLMTDGDTGERFFDEAGEVAEPTKQVLEFLSTVEANRQPTQNASAALARAGVIKPWDITLKTDAGDRKLDGLHQIDEAALNALPAEAFEALRQAGALPIAYCQMLSMQHLPGLGKLAEAHAAHRGEADRILKSSFVEPNQGEIDIDWSQFNTEDS